MNSPKDIAEKIVDMFQGEWPNPILRELMVSNVEVEIAKAIEEATNEEAHANDCY